MAAIATFALKPGVWFRRVRLVIVSPDSQRTACLLSGRYSTYRPVQISGTGSQALRQHMHQEAADELVGIERHHPVSLPTFEAVILPFEGDALVIERDQAAVGDGDAVGVAREIGQDFRGSPEWAFAVDHPFAVAQRRQVRREG